MSEASSGIRLAKGDHLGIDNSENSMAAPDEAGEIKRRLIKRMVLAGGLIVALLAGLAIVDSLNAPPVVESVTEAPSISAPQSPPAEMAPAVAVAPEAEKPAEEPPPAPEVSAAPSLSGKPELIERIERPLTKPAVPQLAMVKPAESLPFVRRVEPARELANQGAVVAPFSAPAGMPAKAASGAPASRPLSNLAAPHAPVAEPRNSIFLLQLGVFSSTANAEELRAKLELNGIPSQIEARVQVGPFKSRMEAEQVREKLRALGIEPGLVVAGKK